jgi:hypothetical protein
MAAITGDFPPGPYEVTWNGTSIGMMEGSIHHQQMVIGAPIRASLYGQTILDYILQGMFVNAVLVMKEWNAGSKAAMWPFNAVQGIVGEAGLLFNPLYKQMVMTALTGTPAATEGPVTRTYPLSGLLPGHNLDVTMGPEERNVPVAFTCLPEPDSTSKRCKFFTDT